MRVPPILTLPVLLLSLSTSALAESSAKTVQEIVQDANRLLAEGSYSQAARAYTDAIGM
jgi:DnaJ family protein C protein 3